MAGKIKQKFEDHFDEFLDLYRANTRKVVIEDVKRMIDCGDLSKGYKEYSCISCDEVKKIAFRCKSRFCTTCGKKYVDDRADKMTEKLIKVTHRHMVFTIPEELRIYFRADRKLLNLLPQLAYKVLKAYFHKRSKRESFIPGITSLTMAIFFNRCRKVGISFCNSKIFIKILPCTIFTRIFTRRAG